MPPGGRIVINPEELRRGATRIHDVAAQEQGVASKLRGLPQPIGTPPGVSGAIEAVASALAAQTTVLAEATRELKARALWAEIADQMAMGYPLTGSQLSAFLAGMKDGSLLRYAEPWQARLAGEYVANYYADGRRYEDPAKLIELADLLRTNMTAPDAKLFAASFFDTFGAENTVHVVRVIQAMEWTNGLTMMGPTSDSQAYAKLGNNLYLKGYELKRDPVDLLSSFSIAFAFATVGGLSTKTQDEVASTDDQWALGQLLGADEHTVYSTHFLHEVFNKQVVPGLVRDSTVSLGPTTPLSYWAIGARFDHPLGTDARVLMMEAIARNPEASAVVLTSPLPERVEFFSRWGGVSSQDPLTVLMHGDWSDDGRALGHTWESAIGALHDGYDDGTGAIAADTAQAANLTERYADAVIKDTRSDLPQLRIGLAGSLADHYMADLHLDAAGEETSASYDGDRDSYAGSSSATGIRLSTPQLMTLMEKFAGNDEANRIFLAGVADHQSQYIDRNAVGNPPDGASWAKQIGNFNGLLENANDLHRIDDHDQAVKQHDLILKAITAPMDFIPAEGTAAKIGVHAAKELVPQLFSAPPDREVTDQNFQLNQAMRVRMEASIISGYYEHHGLGTEHDIKSQVDAMRAPGVDKQQFFENGHIIPYEQMTQQQRDTFNLWKQLPEVQDRVAGPVGDANAGMNDRDYDTGKP